jgi:hypothetical protein
LGICEHEKHSELHGTQVWPIKIGADGGQLL